MANIVISSGTVSAIGGMGLERKGIAGEVLGAGNACRIGANGLVYQADASTYTGGFTGTAGKADFDGLCVQNAAVGDAVTLYGNGAVIGGYAAGMTAGNVLWVGAADGALSDAKVATQDAPVAKILSATDLLIIR